MHIPKNILYLVHATSQDPKQLKYLETRPYCDEINTALQFPGVYFSLITKKNINTELIYPGKYVLIFSVDLLKQSNWHINIKDHNGNITEKNTYYPWNYQKVVNKLSDMNEVVFHDPIDMKYLCKTLIRPSIDNEKKYLAYSLKGGINAMLPKRQMSSSTPPDLTKKPFYVFTERHYTGTTEVPKSSLSWYKMMAKVANIFPIPDTKQKIIELLEKKSHKICVDRNLQDITHLIQWTQRHTIL